MNYGTNKLYTHYKYVYVYVFSFPSIRLSYLIRQLNAIRQVRRRCALRQALVTIAQSSTALRRLVEWG